MLLDEWLCEGHRHVVAVQSPAHERPTSVLYQPDDIDDYIRGLVSLNRNIAIHGTRIIDTSNDDYIYAVDARTGELVWETEILDFTPNGEIPCSS